MHITDWYLSFIVNFLSYKSRIQGIDSSEYCYLCEMENQIKNSFFRKRMIFYLNQRTHWKRVLFCIKHIHDMSDIQLVSTERMESIESIVNWIKASVSHTIDTSMGSQAMCDMRCQTWDSFRSLIHSILSNSKRKWNSKLERSLENFVSNWNPNWFSDLFNRSSMTTAIAEEAEEETEPVVSSPQTKTF